MEEGKFRSQISGMRREARINIPAYAKNKQQGS